MSSQSLANEHVHPAREKDKNDIARWIELRYSKSRLHSGLDYRIPQEVLDKYLNEQEFA